MRKGLLIIFILILCFPIFALEKCKASYENKPMDLIITDEKFFSTKGATGEVRALASIENPNNDLVPYQIEFDFSGYDASGNLIDTSGNGVPGARVSTIYIIPPKTKVTIFNTLYDQTGKVAKVKLNLHGIEWKEISGPIPEMKIYNVNLQVKEDYDYMTVSGVVTNQSPDYTTNAWVLISLLDANGNPVDGEFCIVSNVKPQRALPFERTFCYKWGSTSLNVVAYPCSIKDFKN